MFNNAFSSGSDFLSLETSLRYSLKETELPVMSADTVLAASDACSLSKIYKYNCARKWQTQMFSIILNGPQFLTRTIYKLVADPDSYLLKVKMKSETSRNSMKFLQVQNTIFITVE